MGSSKNMEISYVGGLRVLSITAVALMIFFGSVVGSNLYLLRGSSRYSTVCRLQSMKAGIGLLNTHMLICNAQTVDTVRRSLLWTPLFKIVN